MSVNLPGSLGDEVQDVGHLGLLLASAWHGLRLKPLYLIRVLFLIDNGMPTYRIYTFQLYQHLGDGLSLHCPEGFFR